MGAMRLRPTLAMVRPANAPPPRTSMRGTMEADRARRRASHSKAKAKALGMGTTRAGTVATMARILPLGIRQRSAEDSRSCGTCCRDVRGVCRAEAFHPLTQFSRT